MKTDKVYFPGLNGIRFFAAFAVIIHHIEQFKFDAGFSNWWGNPFIDSLGHKAVSIFFTLSGFLITYLLFAEISKTGTVNIKKFYLRRILRIWPLYFLIGFMAFFIIPKFIVIHPSAEYIIEDFNIKLFFYVIILPNVIRIMDTNQLIGGAQAWSIGVEEQFYILWPLFIKAFRNNVLTFLFWFVAIKLALAGIVMALIEFNLIEGALLGFLQKFHNLWYFFQIEQMAIGAMGAYVLYYKKDKIVNFLYLPVVQMFAILSLAVIFIVDIDFIGYTVIEAVIYTILIMNISCNPQFFLKLESKPLNYLGNISYGIYMYHSACIAILLTGMIHLKLFERNEPLANILFYAAVPVATIIVSSISSKYFENYFLRFKKKLAVVKSGA